MKTKRGEPATVTALKRAIEVVDGQAALARILAERTGKPIRQGHVWAWLNRAEKTPPEMAPHIEAITAEKGYRVTREELCPEFPWEAPAQSAEAHV